MQQGVIGRPGWAEELLTDADDATGEFDQTWFAFQHGLSCGPHNSSIGVEALGFTSYIEAPILIIVKKTNCRFDLIIGPMLPPSQVFFHVEEQKNFGAKSGEYGG